MRCETDGCPQYAEFYDPMGNKLCSDCIQIEVETGEYLWDECEAIEDVSLPPNQPLDSDTKSSGD